jgi:hypothetical protein
MPFAPSVGTITEVLMKGTLAAAGSNIKNVASVFHYRLSALGSSTTKAALQTIFQTTIGVPLLAAFCSRYTQVENSVRWMNDFLDAPQSFAQAGVGAIATDGMPTVDSVYLLLRTGLRHGFNRGSKHFPAVNEIDTTGDVLTGAGLARWQTVQTAVFSSMTDALGNIWIPSVVSKKKTTIAGTVVTPFANDVTQVLLNKTIGTMRRRRVLTAR